mmetsp:Transcript_31823/g.47969  ORF Transcript_31823/g.47969 Transcript_31823/m.47969 type:complete len:257 (-) Transcript_31823:1387-2157(-)
MESMTRHVYVKCYPRRKSCTRKIEGRRRVKIPPLGRMKKMMMVIRNLPIILMDIEDTKTTTAVAVAGIIEEIDHIMAEGDIMMIEGEMTVVGEIIMIVVVVMGVGGTIIGTVAEGEEAGVMTGGTMVEEGGINRMSVNPPPMIAAVDVRGVGASLDPPLEVEVGATPHRMMDLDHQAATHLGVIVEAILEVSPARPLGIHTIRRHKIKNANEATLLTLREMKRRSTVGPIQTHQSRKVMLMPSQKISAPSLYLNLS